MNAFVFRALAVATIACMSTPTYRQDNAFSYQGRLENAGMPASGVYDFRFALFDSASGGGIVALPLTNSAVSVSNGLLTATLDFGPNAFTNANRWLQVAVRTNGAEAFLPLSPRQRITPAPSALFAQNAQHLSGTLTMSQLPADVVTNNQSGVSLAGIFSGDAFGLTNISLTGFSQAGANKLRFIETPGIEQVYLRAAKNLDIETVNSATFWAGQDFNLGVDRNFVLHVSDDSTLTFEEQLSALVGLGLDLQVGQNLSLSVGAALTLEAQGNASVTIGGNAQLSVGNNLSVQAGQLLLAPNQFSVQAQNIRMAPTGVAGFGTANPQAHLHVYGTASPTTVRVQSAGTPGAARVEFAAKEK
jgi:hypothetical protein